MFRKEKRQQRLMKSAEKVMGVVFPQKIVETQTNPCITFVPTTAPLQQLPTNCEYYWQSQAPTSLHARSPQMMPVNYFTPFQAFPYANQQQYF